MRILAILFLCFFFSQSLVIAQEKIPQLVLQNGHSSWITTLKYSSDGKTLATGDYDGNIKLWNVECAKIIKSVCIQRNFKDFRNISWSPYKSPIIVLDFSLDGKILIAGNKGGDINLWDISSGKIIQSFSTSKYQLMNRIMTLSPKKNRLVKVDDGKYVALWDIYSGKKIDSFEEKYDEIGTVIFAPDGKSIIYGGKYGHIKFWNITTGKLDKTLIGQPSPISSLCYSPDGKTIVSGGRETLILYDTESKLPIKKLKGHSEEVTSLVFSSDGKTIISGSKDKTIKIWKKILNEEFHEVKTIDFSVERKTSISESYDKIRSITVIIDGINYTNTEKRSSPFIIDFSPNDSSIAIGCYDGSVRIMDSDLSKYIIKKYNGQKANRIKSISFSPDGKYIAVLNWDKTINLWVANSGILHKTLIKNSSDFHNAFFLSNNEDLAVICSDGSVKIWNTSSGRFIEDIIINSRLIGSAISPDGKILASMNIKKNISFWDISSKSIIKTISVKSFNNIIAISNDCKKLVYTNRYNTINILNINTNEIMQELKGHSEFISTMIFSPTKEILASGSFDNSIKLWDINTGKLKQNLDSHSKEVFSLAFSPDGNLLASGGNDNDIKIWEVESGRLINTLKGHSSRVASLAFSPSGETLVSGSIDNSLKFWKVFEQNSIATSLSLSDSIYITYTKQGYYVASDKGDSIGSWRINNKGYLLEQYSEILNRPELVQKVLAGNKVASPKINFEKDLPPKISWINPIDSTNEKQYDLIVKYEGKHALEKMDIIHNDSLLNIEVPNTKNNFEIKIPINLTAIKNKVVISVSDVDQLKSNKLIANFEYSYGSGRKGSKTQETESDPSKDTHSNYEKKYALVVGVSDYKDLPNPKSDLKDLKYAHMDASSFKKFLEDEKVSGGEWNITYLANEEATKKNISLALRNILTKGNEKDLIYIFFSGHGKADDFVEDKVYLLPYDYDIDYIQSGLDYDFLLSLICKSKTQHIIAFIDACKSGTIGFAKGDKPSSFYYNILADRLKLIPENKAIYSSCSGIEESHEDDFLKAGVFTYYLIKGLYGEADEYDNADFVDLGELHDYVRFNVLEYTKNHKKHWIQRPDLIESKGLIRNKFPVSIRTR